MIVADIVVRLAATASVIPAKAGIQSFHTHEKPTFWTPTFAGVTVVACWMLFMATSKSVEKDLLEKEIAGGKSR